MLNIPTTKFLRQRRQCPAHPGTHCLCYKSSCSSQNRTMPCIQGHRAQVHLPRLLPETRHLKVPETQRASAQHRWWKNHLLSHFCHLEMQHCLHGSLPRALKGREKMKRTAFKEALFLYLIKANLYFKCCFWYLYCFLILRGSFSFALELVALKGQAVGYWLLSSRAEKGWWGALETFYHCNIMTKFKNHYIPAETLSDNTSVTGYESRHWKEKSVYSKHFCLEVGNYSDLLFSEESALRWLMGQGGLIYWERIKI